MPELDDKKLNELIEATKKANEENPDVDVRDLEEFQELGANLEKSITNETKLIQDATEEVHSNTEVLKDFGEANVKANKAQIAYEVFKTAIGRRKDKAEKDRLEKVDSVRYEKQKKHNAGAKDAREIILEQGKIGLENDQIMMDELKELRKENDAILAELTAAEMGIAKGDLKKGSDGDVYEFEGAQWVNQDTGRMATKKMAKELNVPSTTSRSAQPKVVKVEVENTQELSDATKAVQEQEYKPTSGNLDRVAQPTAETGRTLSDEEIKRLAGKTTVGGETLAERGDKSSFSDLQLARQRQRAVSYTHLTLPTTPYV